MAKDVIVVTGIGGMGIACARRLGTGNRLVIADFAPDKLKTEADVLADEGFDVIAQPVDVTDRDAVDGLAKVAADAGRIRTIVHTAGVSPTMASGPRVLEIDLLGTEHMLNAFLPHAVEGTVAVCIASMAGYVAGLRPEVEDAIAAASSEDLVAATGLDLDTLTPEVAYCVAKRGAQLRVERAAPAWGKQGARVVSISPGIISTPMGHQEAAAQPMMATQLGMSPLPRLGTAQDIAAAAEWLASPAASFVTGCDMRIDGGVTAMLRGFDVSQI